MQNKIEQITTRSEYVEEVLGQIPPRVIRYGTLFFFFFIFLLVALSFVIKYPDTVNSRLTITSLNPTVHIFTLTSGRIDTLFVQNKQIIASNAPIAYIDNPVKYNDAVELSKIFDRLNTPKGEILLRTFKPNYGLHLGEAQNQYSLFLQSIEDLQTYLNKNDFRTKSQSLQAQLQQYENLLIKLADEQALAREQLIISAKNLKRSRTLLQSKTISEYDFEQVELSNLLQKSKYKNIESNIIDTRIRKEENSRQLLILQQETEKEYKSKINHIEELSYDLESFLHSWQKKYVITSPIAGTVVFHTIWNKDQFVTQNNEIVSILPVKQNAITAKLILPEQNSGKVHMNQKVIIKLDGYNYKEFGSIIGKVKSISLTPKNNSYAVDVELPDGLTTTYGKKIPFTQEIKGSGEIITEDLRLIERIFYSLRSVFIS